MSDRLIPGTTIPDTGAMSGGMFAALRPMIAAANGLTLAQVCAITGLECSTVQNWVKREFVAHPENKKYYDRHLARILIISMLRDSLKIDDVGELMRLINGDATDESDDIIPETELYDLLCDVIAAASPDMSETDIRTLIAEKTAPHAMSDDAARARLEGAMLVMVNAYFAGVLVRRAEDCLTRLTVQ